MQVESILFEIISVILLILANAFFVAAEFAIVKVRSTQIQALAEKNNRRAKVALNVVSHVDEYLSATQLGITMTSLGLGWIGEPVTAKILEPVFSLLSVTNPNTIHAISLSVGFIIITALHIVIGEQAPKMIAIKFSKRTVLFVSIPLNIFYSILKHAIWLLNTSSNLLLKTLGIQPVAEM